MKTYQEYYNEWQNSTESRDLSFEEWLMLLLDRKEKEMIDKAWVWIEKACSRYPIIASELPVLNQSFTKSMEE